MPDGRQFNFSIVTPERVLVEGKAEFLALPGLDGEYGVLFNRSPLLVRLQPGLVRVQSGGREEWYFVAGGFGDVIDNHVSVLTPRAYKADQVKPADAEAAHKRASTMAAPDAAGERKLLDAQAEAHAMDRMVARLGR